MNDLERDFVGDDDVHYEPGDEVDYDDMPGLINCEDNMDHLNIMHLYGDFNRFNDNDYDCEEIKEELEAETHGELETETHRELDTETHGELETGLKNEMNEVHPEPAINREIEIEIEVSPKQTKSFCIIC